MVALDRVLSLDKIELIPPYKPMEAARSVSLSRLIYVLCVECRIDSTIYAPFLPQEKYYPFVHMYGFLPTLMAYLTMYKVNLSDKFQTK